MLSPKRCVGWALFAGVVACLASLVATSGAVSVRVGSPGWHRAVMGAEDGVVRSDVIVTLPGVNRRQPRELLVRSGGDSMALGVSLRGQPVQWLRFSGAGAGVVRIPPSVEPGLRLRLLRVRDEPAARVTEIVLRHEPLRTGRAVAAGMLASALALGCGLLSPPLTAPLAFWSAGVAGVLTTPAIELWLSPRLASWRVLLPMLIAALGLAVAWRAGRLRRMWLPATLVAGFALGLVLRITFLPAFGGFDIDDGKAWAQRAEEFGTTRAYGGTDAVPRGSFFAQLTGREPAWQIEKFGRSFSVAHPPGLMVAWVASWHLVRELGPPLGDAAWNVAVKLPTVGGDLLALLLLVGLHRRRPRAGWILAITYWCAPPTWLGGALLGFVDGAYAPFAAAAMVAAGSGRAVWAGGLLAVATLLNLASLLAAPAAIAALLASRASVGRAVGVGLLVGGAALVPFAFAGTLDTTLVHVLRVLVAERLSEGFANVWWVVGHASNVMKDPAPELTSRVPYVRLDEMQLPVRFLGTASLASLVAYSCVRLRTVGGVRLTLMVAGLTAFAYGMLAAGVRQNDPFPLLLLLMAAGLPSASARITWSLLVTTYTLNLVALEGFGRFYDLRYVALEPLIEAAQGVRMAAGIDITLILAAINMGVFVWAWRELPREFERASVRLQQAGLGGRE